MSYPVLQGCDSRPPLIGVLPLVIQHSSISSAVESVCSLLCTSQQAAQAVQQNCIGRVDLRVQLPAQMSWFAKHCRLVKSLNISAGFNDTAMLEGLGAAAARCAEAEAAAAAQGRPGASQLCSLKAFALPSAALTHLQPMTTLTSLSFRALDHNYHFTKEAEACKALAGLASLRCLNLSKEAGSLLPGTSSLTNLTSMLVEQLRTERMPNLRHVPPQLQELTMSLSRKNAEHPAIDLSHLTGLTRLVATGAHDPYCHDDSGLVVGGARADAMMFDAAGARSTQLDDKLPPNCQYLSVVDVVSAQPLLELQQLERLVVERYRPKAQPEVQQLERRDVGRSFPTTQPPLQQLSSLSRLTDLQISAEVAALAVHAYKLPMGVEPIDACLSRWEGLPSLRGLRVCGASIGDLDDPWDIEDFPVLVSLSQLSTLQRLSMSQVELEDYTGSSWLADIFEGLRGLHSLWLSGCKVDTCSYRPRFAGVAGAIAALPALRDLRLADLEQWDETASAALAAATQLTGLLLATKGSSNEFVSLVGQVHKLVGLRSLWIDSEGMDTFGVDAAATSLVHLTELCLRGCDPHLLVPKFPGAALGRVSNSLDSWCSRLQDPCNRVLWRVQWWSSADGTWKGDGD